jgi:hypothetical protein
MPVLYRQEVLNVLLAQLLQERGVVTAPESIIKTGPEQQRSMPDVLIDFKGLRLAIEGEVGDQPDAEYKALESARNRVVTGIAHIGIGVVYPAELRKVEFKKRKAALEASQLRIAVVTESGATGYVNGDVDYLKEALSSAFDQLVKEDVVAHAVAVLDAGVGTFANRIVTSDGIMSRMAEVLGIRELPERVVTQKEEIE